jgi:SNF2 family DNA or RNA helicase
MFCLFSRGLGKTIQALSCLAVLRVEQLLQSENISDDIDPAILRTQLLTYEMRPCLIVCPASLTFHWQAEILKYFESSNIMKATICTNETFREFHAETFAKIPLHKPNAFIISYDMLRKYSLLLGSIVWDMVIIDEAHMIRNPATVVAKSIFNLQARYRLALTGTPIQNQVLYLQYFLTFSYS